jgi:hypothetical protein
MLYPCKRGMFSMPIQFNVHAHMTSIDIKFAAKNFDAELISACPITIQGLSEQV